VLESKFKGETDLWDDPEEYGSSIYYKTKRGRNWQEILKFGDFPTMNPHKIAQ
jgi:hypothetical protein